MSIRGRPITSAQWGVRSDLPRILNGLSGERKGNPVYARIVIKSTNVDIVLHHGYCVRDTMSGNVVAQESEVQGRKKGFYRLPADFLADQRKFVNVNRWSRNDRLYIILWRSL